MISTLQAQADYFSEMYVIWNILVLSARKLEKNILSNSEEGKTNKVSGFLDQRKGRKKKNQTG